MPSMLEAALQCTNLVKQYDDVVAVDGLDLRIERGECFGLLGPNGAGKTTTVEIFEGLLPPTSGTVEVLGLRWDRDARRLRERLGIQLQESQFSDKLSVGETVRLFRSFYSSGLEPDEAIRLVALEEKQRAWTRKLSGGQRQRLSLACALVCDPDLLFLDEPTTGLDPQSRRKIWDIVDEFRSRDRTVMMTTHYMEEAEKLCDRVAIIDRGKVIALGTPRELIASLGAEHIVEFDVEGTLQRDPLEQLDGVLGIDRRDDALRLNVSQVHRAIPALLEELSRQQVALTHLTTHNATLEDVFVFHTGRQLRDN